MNKFPDNFYWGAATSSHQVEGNNHNDWAEWEKATADGKLQIANGKNWPDYILKNYPNPLQKKNYISGSACGHYNRFKEDFDIAESLDHNTHRFSIEWSRIEPKEGNFNEKEIGHYRQVIKALKSRGLEPFITLWHWSFPLWIAKQGGWQNKKSIYYFVRYVEKIVSALGNDVKFWLTLNEPEIYSINSYLKGQWPPQKKNPITYLKVTENLIEAHKKSYKIIKKNQPSAQIGIAKNNIYFESHQNKFINHILKKAVDWWWNFYFLNQIKNYQDFIGLNHYFHNRINFGFNKNENKKVSDTGWELYPEGIYFCLKDLKKYQKPIYITENGLADSEDKNREGFIKETLRNVYKAIKDGVDVRGYFYWSLLDNFEWDKGFWPRFGLVEIDYKTLERKIRPSAWEYKKIIENGLSEN
ncbi:glycoside hydrolase family 1 protein [Candidatus Wolfebacteria bacterium]|nr:glycoside hydrolase family 1 protein [Candidatus Wolfebacteria bacterium]